jgi:lipopolysaccharide/colanic/teichoic acid biosynthesis glycosyltransferase
MKTKKEKIPSIGGYSKTFYILNRFSNVLLAFILIIFALPVFLVIALIIKLQDGGPIIYAQARLGLNKKNFTMYKFRSLVPDADKITGGKPLETVAERHSLMTPFGKFLRESRFDELPQLFNILKGEMDFIGPRPQPSAFYEKFWKNVKDYDKRFTVRPGLIGYPQLFLPHFAPKRIQALLDNRYLEKKQKPFWDAYLIILTICVVLIKSYHLALKSLWHHLLMGKIMGFYKEKRFSERLKFKGRARVYFGPPLSDRSLLSERNRPLVIINEERLFDRESDLIDINEEALLVASNHPLDELEFIFKMETDYKSIWRRATIRKSTICYGKLYRKIHTQNDYDKYVIKYDPISSFNYYKLHQYFLHESLID